MQSLTFLSNHLNSKGAYFDGRILYNWNKPLSIDENFYTSGNLSFSLQGATKEFMAIYFDVLPQFATETRPQYESKPGILLSEISFFQGITSGDKGLYFGGSWDYYGNSVNRKSPLHKSDQNFTTYIGFTTILGKSKNKAYDVDDTEGLINHIKSK